MVFIRKLNLTNFRNHQILSLEFGEGINLILGGNAEGKTNIIESIYLLGVGKSFRVGDHRDVIGWGGRECIIEGEFWKTEGVSRAICRLNEGLRTYKVDGKRSVPGRPAGIVLFAPHDVGIFRASPSERRSWLDDAMFQTRRGYGAVFKEYERTLLQRNCLLKEGMEKGWSGVERGLAAWTERLVRSGTALINERISWLQGLNAILPEMYINMGGVGGGLEIEYQVHFSTDGSIVTEQEYYRALSERSDLERLKGVTLAGPHRDDWSAKVGGRDIKYYGSQGQMRTAALSMKAAEAELLKDVTGETPILLLDDIVSELDQAARGKLLGFVSRAGGQIFITSTSDDMKEFVGRAAVFMLSNGEVKRVCAE